MLQRITLSCGTSVSFIDRKENHHAARCQPRDIDVVEGSDSPRVREEIAHDIRLGQGVAPIGAARGMRHE